MSASAVYRRRVTAVPHPTNRDRTTPPLWLCIHEAGHAVAHLVLDELPPYPGPSITSVSVIPDGDFRGRVRGQRRVWTKQFSRDETEARLSPALQQAQHQMALYDVIEALAGYVAEMYQRQSPFGPLMIKPEMFEKILVGDLDSIGDMAGVRNTIDWLGLVDPAAELKRLFRTTYGLIASEWPGIVRVARVLRTRPFMEGEEFEAEWQAVRSTAAIRQRLEARIGSSLAGWRDRLLLPGILKEWA